MEFQKGLVRCIFACNLCVDCVLYDSSHQKRYKLHRFNVIKEIFTLATHYHRNRVKSLVMAHPEEKISDAEHQNCNICRIKLTLSKANKLKRITLTIKSQKSYFGDYKERRIVRKEEGQGE
ncbi:hypothetical protein YC2023_042410 [Brassica napus]